MIKSYYGTYDEAVEDICNSLPLGRIVIKRGDKRVIFELNEEPMLELHKHPVGGWIVLSFGENKVKVSPQVFEGLTAAIKEGVIDRNKFLNIEYQHIKCWMMDNEYGATASWMRSNYVTFKQGVYSGFEVDENAKV